MKKFQKKHTPQKKPHFGRGVGSEMNKIRQHIDVVRINSSAEKQIFFFFFVDTKKIFQNILV